MNGFTFQGLRYRIGDIAFAGKGCASHGITDQVIVIPADTTLRILQDFFRHQFGLALASLPIHPL
jgi:hypothetical protein